MISLQMNVGLTSPRLRASHEQMSQLQKLDKRRLRILATLDPIDCSDDRQDATLLKIEKTERLIASTPAMSLDDLQIKVRRLFSLIYPSDAPLSDLALEDAFMRAILEDIAHLIDVHSS